MLWSINLINRRWFFLVVVCFWWRGYTLFSIFGVFCWLCGFLTERTLANSILSLLSWSSWRLISDFEKRTLHEERNRRGEIGEFPWSFSFREIQFFCCFKLNLKSVGNYCCWKEMEREWHQKMMMNIISTSDSQKGVKEICDWGITTSHSTFFWNCCFIIIMFFFFQSFGCVFDLTFFFKLNFPI